MPGTVNSILNKQFLRRAFELPAAGIDRWLQSEIRRAVITFQWFQLRKLSEAAAILKANNALVFSTH
jgi:hypothetical protein